MGASDGVVFIEMCDSVEPSGSRLLQALGGLVTSSPTVEHCSACDKRHAVGSSFLLSESR